MKMEKQKTKLYEIYIDVERLIDVVTAIEKITTEKLEKAIKFYKASIKKYPKAEAHFLTIRVKGKIIYQSGK